MIRYELHFVAQDGTEGGTVAFKAEDRTNDEARLRDAAALARSLNQGCFVLAQEENLTAPMYLVGYMTQNRCLTRLTPGALYGEYLGDTLVEWVLFTGESEGMIGGMIGDPLD